MKGNCSFHLLFILFNPNDQLTEAQNRNSITSFVEKNQNSRTQLRRITNIFVNWEHSKVQKFDDQAVFFLLFFFFSLL